MRKLFVAILFIPFVLTSCGPDNKLKDSGPTNDYTDTELLKKLNVKIEVLRGNGNSSKGSGVCLGPSLIATNYHVVYPYKKGKVRKVEISNQEGLLTGIRSVNVSAIEHDILFINTTDDICSDYVPAKDLLPLPEVDESLVHVGNPAELDWVIREGAVVDKSKLMELPEHILERVSWLTASTSVALTSIDTTHGSSGGGVYTENGLVGVLFASGAGSSRDGKETLIISGKYLNSYQKIEHDLSFEKFVGGLDQAIAIEVKVNHDVTKFILTDIHSIKKKSEPEKSIEKSNLYSNELRHKMEAHSLRYLHFFNFSPDQTVVVYLSDTNKDTIVDSIMILRYDGYHKTISDDLVPTKGLVMIDNDFDQKVDEFGPVN